MTAKFPGQRMMRNLMRSGQLLRAEAFLSKPVRMIHMAATLPEHQLRPADRLLMSLPAICTANIALSLACMAATWSLPGLLLGGLMVAVNAAMVRRAVHRAGHVADGFDGDMTVMRRHWRAVPMLFTLAVDRTLAHCTGRLDPVSDDGADLQKGRFETALMAGNGVAAGLLGGFMLFGKGVLFLPLLPVMGTSFALAAEGAAAREPAPRRTPQPA